MAWKRDLQRHTEFAELEPRAECVIGSAGTCHEQKKMYRAKDGAPRGLAELMELAGMSESVLE
jgi:hypothetical protein